MNFHLYFSWGISCIDKNLLRQTFYCNAMSFGKSNALSLNARTLQTNSLNKCVIWTQVSILYLVRKSKGHLAIWGIFLNIPISLGANYLFLERLRYFTFTSLERSFSRNWILLSGNVHVSHRLLGIWDYVNLHVTCQK